MARTPEPETPSDIAIVGDLTERGPDICDKLLGIPQRGECTLYFDSPGGSAYAAVSLLTLIAMRELRATGIVIGECSSAAIWPLAACQRRIVTPFSVLLFHPLKWQSEENIGLSEAAEWARHFGELEHSMDELLATFLGVSIEKLTAWMQPGRYVTGQEFAAAGLAEIVDLASLAPGAPGADGGRTSSRKKHK